MGGGGPVQRVRDAGERALMATSAAFRLACAAHPRYEGTRRKKDMNCLACVALRTLNQSGAMVIGSQLKDAIIVVERR